MPPVPEMTYLAPTEVHAAGGFDDEEMPSASTDADHLAMCTDGSGSNTPCVPYDREHPVCYCP
jgi:hypothetical protein|tara:strand:- start:9113 stop:9301 length:189 start_codon:yes stop_codon:yes gene_type:complete